jgi:hypothetical protein
MIAGPRSCACPECGAVCQGRFSGCEAVWAAGPQNVNLRRPRRETSPRITPELAATNGRRIREDPADTRQYALPAPAPAYQQASRTGPAPVPDESSAADVAELRSLLEGVRTAIDALPGRIAKVAGDAMRQQHNTNKQDLAALLAAVNAGVEQIKNAPVPQPPLVDPHGASAQVIVEQVDARFQWLVDELSQRFMTLGNELVRIENRVTEVSRATTATNGRTERNISRNPS